MEMARKQEKARQETKEMEESLKKNSTRIVTSIELKEYHSVNTSCSTRLPKLQEKQKPTRIVLKRVRGVSLENKVTGVR